MDLNLAGIKAFAFDIDGVFTDGGIFCDLSGELFRTFDSKDGFAVRMAALQGYKLGIITGGRSGSIRARFLNCGIKAEDIYLGSRDKIEDFEDFCSRHSLSPSEVTYVGDDIPDIDVLEACGLSACPFDSVPEVLAVSSHISPFPGGKGCVREVIELVMKAQGKWVFDVQGYKRMF